MTLALILLRQDFSDESCYFFLQKTVVALSAADNLPECGCARFPRSVQEFLKYFLCIRMDPQFHGLGRDTVFTISHAYLTCDVIRQ